MRGVVPAMLQLVYLGNGEMLRYVPDEADLLATERKIEAIWQAIRLRRGDRRLAAQPVQAVRLVRPQGHLPGLGWHSPTTTSEHSDERACELGRGFKRGD